ncbi:uncharacterized protein M6B38_339350 [Iris pallida]|uniref:Uncharacterized protein n=1 Tax=Iris pallida TaxID=29817 RepID=A0AAX6GXP7_IRIPA|nr:uncharacterized protein M6B38_339350 [Iris pallida]
MSPRMAATGGERLDGRAIFKKITAALVDLVLLLVKFVSQRFFRIKIDEPPKAKTTKCLLETVPEADESEEVEEEGELVGFDRDEEEEYTSSFSFKFEYQVPELAGRSKEEEEEEEEPSVKTTSISNCQFSSEKGFSGFFAEPEAMTCSILESFAGPAGGEELAVSPFVSAKDPERSEERSRVAELSSQDERFAGRVEEDLEDPSAESEDVVLSEEEAFDRADEEKALSGLFSAKDFFRNSFIDSVDFMLSNDDEPFVGRGGDKFLSSKGFEKSFKELKDVLLSKNGSFVGREDDDAFLKDQDDIVEEEPVAVDTKATWVEKEASQGFSGFDSDSDSVSSRDGYSVRSLAVDCDSDGFLSERDFGAEEESSMEDIGDSEGKSQLDEVWSMNDSTELELELKELNEVEGEAEESPRPSSSSVLIELTDSSDDELLPPSSRISASATNSASPTRNRLEEKKEPGEEGLQKSEETHTKDLEAEELDELESLWEHQDLIEQLKMELKKARAVGLPTIFEESESPREIEDLKPWRIDEKFSREDPMDELHKFYKSYRERMRKFDILNYQKMISATEGSSPVNGITEASDPHSTLPPLSDSAASPPPPQARQQRFGQVPQGAAGRPGDGLRRPDVPLVGVPPLAVREGPGAAGDRPVQEPPVQPGGRRVPAVPGGGAEVHRGRAVPGASAAELRQEPVRPAKSPPSAGHKRGLLEGENGGEEERQRRRRRDHERDAGGHHGGVDQDLLGVHQGGQGREFGYIEDSDRKSGRAPRSFGLQSHGRCACYSAEEGEEVERHSEDRQLPGEEVQEAQRRQVEPGPVLLAGGHEAGVESAQDVEDHKRSARVVPHEARQDQDRGKKDPQGALFFAIPMLRSIHIYIYI